MATDALFTPFTVKGVALPNRVVMAPMTRSCSPGGVATSEVAAYYRRRAANAVGLSSDFIAGYTGPAAVAASLDELLRRLEREEFDLVGVGRALLHDPEWARKVHAGRNDELKNFDSSALTTLY